MQKKRTYSEIVAEITDENIARAVKYLNDGKLIAFPTETVYGLGADAECDEAVLAIFEAKSRPEFNPVIVHIADMELMYRYCVPTREAERLAEEFWSGALTLILKRRDDCNLSPVVSAGLDTVAIRMPANEVAQKLLSSFSRGVAAPSANRSGRISPTKAEHVFDEFFGSSIEEGYISSPRPRPEVILDGGATEEGIESTIVYCADDSSPPRILRAGSVTIEMLRTICPDICFADNMTDDSRPLSAGMMSSHYAPNASVKLNISYDYMKDLYPEDREAVLAFGLVPEEVSRLLEDRGVTVLNLSPSGNICEAAKNLFAYMRELDSKEGCKSIAVMPIPNMGVGIAINDRLRRAAAPR